MQIRDDANLYTTGVIACATAAYLERGMVLDLPDMTVTALADAAMKIGVDVLDWLVKA